MTAAGIVAGLSAVLVAAADTPVRYVDLATPFQRVAGDTAGRPEAERVAAVRARVDALLPGIYPDDPATGRRLAAALRADPAERAAHDRVIAQFPAALDRAVARFRTVFPAFAPPIPIYLYQSLGQRDGGTQVIEPGHRRVMLFGVDMIARYHSDDSLQPFLTHELFHLEHARRFADCDPLWCAIWQEGLAVAATVAMNPRATDRQLLLDIPVPIRAPTDRRWTAALCFVAAHFEDADGDATGRALLMGAAPPDGLPERFGYYLGFRLAKATRLPVTRLARLDNAAARPVVRDALVRMMADAHATCPLPPTEPAAARK